MTATTQRRIVVVTAGLSQPSSTRLLADQLAAATNAALTARGVAAAVEVIELRDHTRDLANATVTGFAPRVLRAALDATAGADGLIVVSPIYSGSYTGLFKMFFDVLDPESLRGTPVLIAATAGTARHSLALEYALRPLFTYLRAVVVPTAVFAASEDWGAGHADESLTARIRRAAGELATLVAANPPRTRPDPFAESVSFEDLLSAAGTPRRSGETTPIEEGPSGQGRSATIARPQHRDGQGLARRAGRDG